MSLFDEWHRRHLAADPQGPASSPPFKVDDRVVVREDSDDMFLVGLHGRVLDVEHTTDPEDVFGPWRVRVHIDGMRDPLNFESHELVRETGPAPAPVPRAVVVTQPEDEEDFAADAPHPTIPFREDVSATPIYEALRSCAAFPYQVEADLKELTERNAR
jgi:hypothetical protein